MCIGPDHAAAVNKKGWRAVDFKFLSVGVARIYGGPGFRAGHTALKDLGFEPGLAGVFDHLAPGVCRRNDLLIVIDQVVDFPERLRLLLVSAAAGNGCRPRPRVELLEGKV